MAFTERCKNFELSKTIRFWRQKAGSARLIRRLLLLKVFARRRRYGLINWQLSVYRFDTGLSFSQAIIFCRAPLSLLRVDHAELGMQEVTESPHFHYVNAYVSGELTAEHSRRWLDYHLTHSSSRRARPEQMESIFRELIDAGKVPETQFEILVKWEPAHQVFRVVDGFHRLAILAALRPRDLIALRIVS